MHNVHRRTHIKYGILTGNNVPELLDDIQTNGINTTVEEQITDVKNTLRDAIVGYVAGLGGKDALPADPPEAFEAGMKAALQTALRDTSWRPEKLVKGLDTHGLFYAIKEAPELDKFDVDDVYEQIDNAGLWDEAGDSDGDEYVHEWDDPAGHGKIKVQVMYLGGAPLIYVTESPYTALVAPCSPCCPNAGDLDTPRANGIRAYCLPKDDMPDDWTGEVTLLDGATRALHTAVPVSG